MEDATQYGDAKLKQTEGAILRGRKKKNETFDGKRCVERCFYFLTDDGHSGSLVSRACRTKRESFKD